MGRPPDTERRSELLDEIVRYLGEHGLGRLSLRPLADALEVSTYTLVYHFGDKDGLVAAALEHAEARQGALFDAWQRDEPDGDLAALLRRYRDWCRDPENLALVRLAMEAITLSTTELGLPGEQRSRLVTAWVDAIAAQLRADGLRPVDARTRATLINGAFVGMLLDLIATGDERRVDRAFDALAELATS